MVHTLARLTHHGPAAESIEHVKQHKAGKSHGDIALCDHLVLCLRRERRAMSQQLEGVPPSMIPPS